jgi:hypothetical protein
MPAQREQRTPVELVAVRVDDGVLVPIANIGHP